METKRRATAMASLEKNNCPDVRMFHHHTTLDVPVEDGSSAVYSLAAIIFAEMKKRDTGMRIATVDGTTIESSRDIPSDTDQFNEYFKCSVINPSVKMQYVQMRFVLHSKETFGKIKNENWAVLKRNNLWLKRAPGPVKKSDLTLVGFLTKVPRHASLVSILEEIKLEVQKGRALDAEEEISPEVPLGIFLHRSKITGELMKKRVTDNHATAIFVEKLQYKENSTFLEKYCRNLTNNMRFVPMNLKKEESELFGRLLYESIKTTDKYTNIAICGLSPEVMDYGTQIQEDGTFHNFVSLFEGLEGIDGVIRVDTHRCTTTLGKWHITATKDKLESVCLEIDQKLKAIPQFVPADVVNNTIYEDFTAPERLSSSRKPKQQPSTSSSISTTRSVYTTWLTSECSSMTEAPVIEEQPPRRISIHNISYAQAAASTTPTTESNKPGKETTTTHSTQPTATVSTMTKNDIDSHIANAVKIAMGKHQEENKVQIEILTNRLNAFEEKLDTFNTSTISGILKGLEDSAPFVTNQFFTEQIQQLESAFSDNFTMLDKRLTELLSTQWERLTPPSPLRKIARQKEQVDMETDHNASTGNQPKL